MATTINSTFYHQLELLQQQGQQQRIRNTNRYELVDHHFMITQPRDRVLAIPYRYNNIFATMAEVLWVFAGRNDMEYLTAFLPNAVNYSDDGRTWRGGYGPRLRQFVGVETPRHVTMWGPTPRTVDQIQNIVKILQADQYSTQAVMNIYSADRDQCLLQGTKDTPCTMSLQFLIRNNRLHCICNMRSNDILWGCFNINVVEWMFFQEVLAHILKVDVGYYYHNAGSFHYYDTHKKRIDNILNTPQFEIYNYVSGSLIDGMDNYEVFIYNMEVATEFLLENIRHVKLHGTNAPARDNYTSDYIYGMVEMCQCYLQMCELNYIGTGKVLLESEYIPDDLRVAALEYYMRHLKKHGAEKQKSTYESMAKKIIKKYKKHPEVINFIAQDIVNV